jgi:hypothetical protein
VDVRQAGNKAIYWIKDESVFEMCNIVCDGVLRQVQESTRGPR